MLLESAQRETLFSCAHTQTGNGQIPTLEAALFAYLPTLAISSANAAFISASERA